MNNVVVLMLVVDIIFVPQYISWPPLLSHRPLPILQQTIVAILIPTRPTLTREPKDPGKNERMPGVQERIAGHSLLRSPMVT